MARAIADDHADQEESHRSTGEEGEFGVEPAANRAEDTEAHQRENEPNPSAIRPAHEKRRSAASLPAALERSANGVAPARLCHVLHRSSRSRWW